MAELQQHPFRKYKAIRVHDVPLPPDVFKEMIMPAESLQFGCIVAFQGDTMLRDFGWELPKVMLKWHPKLGIHGALVSKKTLHLFLITTNKDYATYGDMEVDKAMGAAQQESVYLEPKSRRIPRLTVPSSRRRFVKDKKAQVERVMEEEERAFDPEVAKNLWKKMLWDSLVQLPAKKVAKKPAAKKAVKKPASRGK
jgi:hypothetical protein